LPPGWLVSVSAPIRFGFDGLCSGGDVTLRSPDGVTETFRLQAPDCRLVPQ
jgi:hypothetical protein